MLNISPFKLDLILTIGIVLLLAGMLYNHRRSNIISKDAATDLGVQDLIENVKTGLIESEQRRRDKNQAALLELKDVDLEINCVVKASGKGSGSVDLKVLTLGSEADVSSEKIQKVRLHLVAVQPQVRQEKASETPLRLDESVVISEPPPKEKK